MGRTVLARAVAAVPMIVLVSMLAFGLVHVMPGSASETILGEGATPEAVAEMDRLLGLDRPLVEQYVSWVSDALQGDFGNSLISGLEVSDMLATRLPATLSLVGWAMLFSVVGGVLAGVLAALRPGTWLDRTVSLASAMGLAVPGFWLAMLLAYNFGVRLEWFPAVGYTAFTDNPWEWARSCVLPALALGSGSVAVIARQTRSGVVDAMDRPYVDAARAKGLGTGRIIVVHALKNALIPVTTVVGFQLALMLGAGFAVEQVFGIPGLGGQVISAVLDRDMPVIQAVVMVMALVVIAVNLLIDLSYAYLDPRVRIE